jgi:chaperonin cofactor prefoldin
MDLLEQLEKQIADLENRMTALEQKQAARTKRVGSVRDEIRKDLGLVKVKGNLGGTYWE